MLSTRISKISEGKVAEYFLAGHLLAHGVVPLWPSSQVEPYDMVINQNGRAVRIQVKGTEQSGKTISMAIKTQRGRYTKRDADVIAIYLFSVGLWYFLPVEKIRTIGVTIKLDSPKCRWKKYKEAWGVILG